MSEAKVSGVDPSPEELAAIVAAIEMSWPRPVAAATEPEAPPPWRFSGRWWARPIAARRDRPWFTQGR